MLFVERSNRTEALLDGLAERLGQRGRDPLARSVVVVQGAGMERWIAQRLASRHGVCANVAFPFPRPFLEEVFDAVARAVTPVAATTDASTPTGGAAGTVAVATASSWDIDRMTWALAALLDEGRTAPAYAPLARHFAGADGEWRLVQLAHQLALVFDQYVTYRPDWILHWEGEAPAPPDAPGGGLAWQPRLFRALRDRLGPGHMARRALDFLRAAERGADIERPRLEAALRRRFPDAVEVFAVSTLPRLHLEVVRALATWIDVRLSVLAPSRAFYAELWRELRAEEAAVGGIGAGGGVGASVGPITGWLAGLGRLGADFQQSLLEVAAPDGGERERFARPEAERGAAPRLLQRLQARLLDLDEVEGRWADRRVARDDDSLRVHLCHGTRRELEVVESVLRDAFERDPTLRPEDAIVMAPDIDAIAGDVEAVFGPGAETPGGIPYRVADRGTWRRSPVAEGFRALLALISTRLARSAVFDWLAQPPVAERFGLDEHAVESLADWAERAGVRFGLDEAQRCALALPAERAHTLAGGIDRLVLAHALGEVSDVVQGLTPVGLGAFDAPEWIGALGEVASLLEDAVGERSAPRTVAAWSEWFERLLGRSLARTDANSHEHLAILDVLERLRSAADAARFTRAIPFEAMREQVVAALEAAPAPQAFLAGGVTFCQLVPLRAIPFRIVVVTGLVDGGFPRSRAARGFDAMAAAPRPGDRSLRDDDRHLFLEAILSARDRLVLTVPARDLRDGQPRPPSVVVSELLDALDASFVLEPQPQPQTQGQAQDELRAWLQVEHPLQDSSPRYFTASERDPRLVSRSERAFRAAQARVRTQALPHRPERRFLHATSDSVSASDSAGPTRMPLDELVERVVRSTRWYAREVLGLVLPRPEARADDLDPLALDPLARSTVGQALFDAFAAGAGVDEAMARGQAHPLVAGGSAGAWMVRPILAEARALAALAAAHRGGRPRPDLAFELVVPIPSVAEGVRLVGRLDGLFEAARVEAGPGRLGGWREAALWIRHLVLCALAERGEAVPDVSVAIGRPLSGDKRACRVVRLGSVADPLARLAVLVDWARSAQTLPLAFFARSSRCYADVVEQDASAEAKAWREARAEFEGRDDGGRRTPEAEEDLETVRVWEGRSPVALAAESALPFGFDALARAFYEPLFAVREARPR
ncbi:MAG: exodeoxyribonuclease V subunit gamma [Myxococcota bacterium]